MFQFKKYLSIVGFLFFLFSCQSETEEQNYNVQETVTYNSPIANYLQRVAMVKTVQDNVIDKSSYCTIKLPYKVIVNNESIALNTTADYKKVIDNINASSSDNDVVTIDFPVTMVYYNYIEKLISNEADFNSLIDYWNLYPDLLFKINGLKINYPIVINNYNSYNQIANAISIQNDQEFFNLINNLSTSQYIALNYPISITDYNNQTKAIANNLDFENAIQNVLDNNPENNNPSVDFIQTITKGSWKIPYFYSDSDSTILYDGYTFVFKNDNSVVAFKSGVSQTGQWEIRTVNNTRKLKVSFSSGVLHKLGYDWELVEFNNSNIRLRDVSYSNYSRYFYLEKI